MLDHFLDVAADNIALNTAHQLPSRLFCWFGTIGFRVFAHPLSPVLGLPCRLHRQLSGLCEGVAEGFTFRGRSNFSSCLSLSRSRTRLAMAWACLGSSELS